MVGSLVGLMFNFILRTTYVCTSKEASVIITSALLVAEQLNLAVWCASSLGQKENVSTLAVESECARRAT